MYLNCFCANLAYGLPELNKLTYLLYLLYSIGYRNIAMYLTVTAAWQYVWISRLSTADTFTLLLAYNTHYTRSRGCVRIIGFDGLFANVTCDVRRPSKLAQLSLW